MSFRKVLLGTIVIFLYFYANKRQRNSLLLWGHLIMYNAFKLIEDIQLFDIEFGIYFTSEAGFLII